MSRVMHTIMHYSKVSSLVSLIFLRRSLVFPHSVVFLYFFALITEEGFLTSPCCSLELCIQMSISFLFSFAFRVSAQLFVRPPQTTILPFLHFFLGDDLDPCFLYNVRNLHPQFFRHSYQIESLNSYLSLPLYNRERFDLGHT